MNVFRCTLALLMLSALTYGVAVHAQSVATTSRPLDLQSLPLSVLETTPARTFGGGDQDLFKVANAMVSPRGEVLITQLGGTSVVRFSLDGQRRADIGRSGKGPGEFQSTSAIALTPHDTLLVYDFMLRRLSVFSPERAFVRSVSTESAAECCSSMGWYLQRVSASTLRTGEAARASMRVATWQESAAGLPADSVSFSIAPPRLVLDYESGSDGTFSFGVTHNLPFNPRPVIALGARHVFSLSGKAFGFDMWTPATSSTVSYRYAVPVRPVAAADVKAVYDSIVERTAEKDKSRVRIAPTHADISQQWVSFDVTGKAITRLRVPRDAQLLSFSNGLALLLEEERETGLQRVLLHRVVLSLRREQ